MSGSEFSMWYTAIMTADRRKGVTRDHRPPRLAAALVLVGAVCALSACTQTLTKLPYFGEPAHIPPPPANPGPYPSAYDVPKRLDKPLTAAERQKLEAELAAARAKQAAESAAAVANPPPER